jgi:hypothetical protein
LGYNIIKGKGNTLIKILEANTMANTSFGREMVEGALDFQLETITRDGLNMAIHLAEIGVKENINLDKPITHNIIIQKAEQLLEADIWENYFSREAVEVLDMVWNTDYHLSIMAKQMDFLFLDWVLQNKYHTKLNLMETILIWGILYIGD